MKIHICTKENKIGIRYRPSQSVDSVVRRLLAKPWMRERAAAAHNLSLSLSLSRPLTNITELRLRNCFIIPIYKIVLSVKYIKI